MQTTKFLSLVKQLIGKDLVTEVDSPSDFSMGGTTDSSLVGSPTSTDTSISTSASTTSTNTTPTDTSTNTSNDDMSTVDLGLDNSNMGGAGLSPSYDDNDGDFDGNIDQQPSMSQAPKFKILDVMFDEDDDLNTKVKIQNIDTGEVEIKNLDEIII